MANASQLFKNDEQERLGNGYVPESSEIKNATGADKDQAKTLSAGGLAAAESNFVDNATSLFNPLGSISKTAKFGKFLLQNRNKAAAGGGIVGLIIGGFFLVFMALIPLKIENMVQNLQKRFFSTSESAIQSETQTLFETYIVKNVMPGYSRCGRIISSTCRATNLVGGTNPVSNLYKAWADSKLETSLASKYGIEFSYDKSGVWHLKGPGTSTIGDSLGKTPTVSILDTEFRSKAGMRAAVKDALASETKLTQVFYRYKVGRLLEQKYGIKRCIVFCGTKDSLSDFKSSKKNAAKIFIAQRVITPLSSSRSIVFQCVLDPNCSPDKVTNNTGTAHSGELNGSPESSVDANLRSNLVNLASHYGITDSKTIQGLIDEYAKIGDAGFQNYALTAVFEKIGLGSASSQALDAIPVVGWVTAGSKIIAAVNNSGPTIKKLAYATNAAAAVSLYMTYRTYADEIHTGNVDPTEVGSFVSSLSSGDSGTANDPQVGGVASAEGTPLYNYLIGSGSTSSAPKISSIFSGTAFAASSTSNSSYVCANKMPVQSPNLVCSEEVLGKGNGALDAAHTILNKPVLNSVTSVADTIAKVSSYFSSLVGKIISSIPGFTSVTNFIGNFMKPFITDIVNVLIPTPFSSNMSGGRTFDMMAAGADVAGNDAAHTTIGGKRLSSTAVAAIINEQDISEKQSFLNKPILARMFDTSSPYSLVSKIALDIPFSFQKNIGNNISSFISSPFGSILHSFGAMFSSPSASAEVAPLADPFNIPQYGYTSSDLAKIGDPEAYWNANCTDNAATGYQKDNSWNIAAQNLANIDPNTGSFVNQDDSTGNGGTNPCLLIKTVVGTAGAVFKTSLLSSGEL